jgi:hypothetical protein
MQMEIRQMKVICVPVSDPIWNSSRYNPHLKEIEQKINPGKQNKWM